MDTPKSAAELHAEVDAYYDQYIWKGMPVEQAEAVQEQRRAAHASIVNQALAMQMEGYARF